MGNPYPPQPLDICPVPVIGYAQIGQSRYGYRKKIVWKYWTSSFNDFGCQLNCAYLPLGIALYFFFHICVHLLPPVVTNVVLLSCRQTNFGLGLSHAFFQNGILVCLFSQISCHLLLCRQFVSLLSKPDWFGVLSFIFLFIFLFIFVSIDCENIAINMFSSFKKYIIFNFHQSKKFT